MTIEPISEESRIPSRFAHVLRALVGHRISGATRYSWWAPEETEQECGVKGQEVFSLTAGPVAIAFDTGLTLGIASEPSANSVCVWIEQDEAGQSARDEPLALDTDLHPVQASDTTYADDFWRTVIGSRVTAVSVLVRRPATARLAELPNEVGLCFVMESGAKVVAAHGLHDDSDDFSMIPYQAILARIGAELEERPL